MRDVAALGGALAVAATGMVGAPAPARSPARDARVAGVVELCGGPAPGHCFVQKTGSVSVRDARHQVVAAEHRQNGRFSFKLRPGSYTLAAKTSAGDRGHRSVRLAAGKKTIAKIVIPIP